MWRAWTLTSVESSGSSSQEDTTREKKSLVSYCLGKFISRNTSHGVWGLLGSFASPGQKNFNVVFECLANRVILKDGESFSGQFVGPQGSLDLSAMTLIFDHCCLGQVLITPTVFFSLSPSLPHLPEGVDGILAAVYPLTMHRVGEPHARATRG